MDPEVVKVLLVGDERCGKTTFLSFVILYLVRASAKLAC